MVQKVILDLKTYNDLLEYKRGWEQLKEEEDQTFSVYCSYAYGTHITKISSNKEIRELQEKLENLRAKLRNVETSNDQLIEKLREELKSEKSKKTELEVLIEGIRERFRNFKLRVQKLSFREFKKFKKTLVI